MATQYKQRPETVQSRWLGLCTRAFIVQSRLEAETTDVIVQVQESTTVLVHIPERVTCYVRKLIALDPDKDQATEFVYFAYPNHIDPAKHIYHALGNGEDTFEELGVLYRTLEEFLPVVEGQPS